MSSLGDFIKNLREKLHKPARGVSVRRSRSTRNIFTAYTAPFPELGTTLSAGSLTMKIPSFGGTEGDSVRSANGTVYAEPEPSFVWVDGRRFHNVKESPYILPNDDIEQDRLVHQHYMIKEAFGRNYQAPVKNLLEDGAKILDMGCGPGTWCMEMASEFPNSSFVGVDISDMFPQAIKPPNTTFTVANVLDGLPFEDNSFDYVFQRLLVFAFTRSQWAIAIRELIRVTKPGGWIELSESDTEPQRTGSVTREMSQRVTHALRARGIDPLIARSIDKPLILHDLEDVRTQFISIPLYWGGRLGEAGGENATTAMRSMKPFLNKALNIPDDKIEATITQIRSNCIEHQSYINNHIAYGRVPLEKTKRRPRHKASRGTIRTIH